MAASVGVLALERGMDGVALYAGFETAIDGFAMRSTLEMVELALRPVSSAATIASRTGSERIDQIAAQIGYVDGVTYAPCCDASWAAAVRMGP